MREYKYLGVMFTTSGKFSVAISYLYSRGPKAYFKLINIFKHAHSTPSTLYIHLIILLNPYYYMLVEYGVCLTKISFASGSPIEKVFNDLQIEKLNIKFCKFILGVNKKASNLAVRGELGRYPLYIDTIITMLKYWLHLHTIDSYQDSQALKDYYFMFHNNQSCWIQCIYLILKELNLLYIFHKPFSLINKTLLDIKQKLKHRFERHWLADINNNKGKSSDMNSGNKLRTYTTFKYQLSCESYIEALKFRERQALSKFRTSAHKIEIERGRYNVPKTPVCNRICKQCSNGLVEDEQHFLLECPKYSLERNTLFNLIQNKTFMLLSMQQKFIWLMSNEETRICKAISQFILQSFDKSDN